MQLARSESASARSGFSWKPWIRPAESVITTPNSLTSETRVTARVAMPSLASWAARRAARSMSVSASAAITRKGSSPKNSATLRTPPAVPSSSSSWL